MNDQFYNRLLAVASLIGLVGVVIGAFGAHFLKSRLEETELDVLRTGVLYLFIHILATFIVAIIARTNLNSRVLKSAAVAFLAGVILFSGSLFIISTRSLTGLPTGFIGPITPIGGLSFIVGWLMLFFYFFSGRKSSNT